MAVAAAGVASAPAAGGNRSARTSVVSEEACSTATAGQLVNRDRLNNFLLSNAVGQVLCGAFTGPGSEAMAVTINAPTCWSPQGWAVYRFTNGAWQLVMVQQLVLIVAPLVAVGSEIKETQPVFGPGDNRCNPSGGTRSRLWHWNGSNLVAGVWKQASPPRKRTAAEFFSPSRNISCEMADDAHNGARVICGAVRKTPHMATMDVSGRLKVCRASAGSTRCLGNVGEGAFVLGYGKSVTVGRFRCFSLRTGMKCIVISSGRGFLINRSGVSRVVP
jgi:hypothetical protein